MAQTSPGSASHGETIPFVLTELKRRMLGAAGPQGPEGAAGRPEGLLRPLPAAPFLPVQPPVSDATAWAPSPRKSTTGPGFLGSVVRGSRRATRPVPALSAVSNQRADRREKDSPERPKPFQS